MNKPRPGSPVQTSELLLYTSPSGAVRVGVLVRDETAWLTQRSLSELFGVGVPAIAKHLKNIFASGELEQSSVLSILETTAADGKVYSTQWYHLDAVIAVGSLGAWLVEVPGFTVGERFLGAVNSRKLCMSMRLQESTELSHRCGDAALALCQLRPTER